MISIYNKNKLKYLQENSKSQSSQLNKIKDNNSLIIRDFNRQNIDSNIYKKIVDLSLDWVTLVPLVFDQTGDDAGRSLEWFNSIDFIIEGIHEDMIPGIKIDSLIQLTEGSEELLSDYALYEEEWFDDINTTIVKSVIDLEEQSPYKDIKINVCFNVSLASGQDSVLLLNPKVKTLIKIIPQRIFI